MADNSWADIARAAGVATPTTGSSSGGSTPKQRMAAFLKDFGGGRSSSNTTFSDPLVRGVLSDKGGGVGNGLSKQQVKQLGAGGDKAESLYERIVKDPAVPDSWKKKAAEVLHGSEGSGDGGGLLSHIPLIGDAAEDVVKSLSPVWTALSIPERAVLTAADTLATPLSNALKGKSTDISDLLSDAGKDLTQGYSFGEFQKEHPWAADAVNPVGELVRAAGGGNKWTNVIGDLVGSIVTDPLTFATGGGAALGATEDVAKGLGKLGEASKAADAVDAAADAAKAAKVTSGTARHLSSRELMSRLADQGLHDEVARVGQRGSRALSADELAEAGLQAHGPGFHVPLTRTLARLTGNPEAAKTVELASYDSTAPLARLLGGLGSKTRGADVASRIEHGASDVDNLSRNLKLRERIAERFGRNAEANRLMRSGNPDAAVEGLRVRQALHRGPLVRAKTEMLIGDRVNDAVKAIDRMVNKADLDPEDVTEALRGDGEAASRVAAAAKKAGVDNPVPDLGRVFEDARNLMNETANYVDPWGNSVPVVARQEDYVPGMRTAAYKDTLGLGDVADATRKGSGGTPGRPAFFENGLRESFGGKNLEEYMQEAAKQNRKLRRDQAMQEIFEKHFLPLGVEGVSVLERDPRVFLPAWSQAVAKRAGTAAVEAKLRDAGLLRPAPLRSVDDMVDEARGRALSDPERQAVNGGETVDAHAKRVLTPLSEREPNVDDLPPFPDTEPGAPLPEVGENFQLFGDLPESPSVSEAADSAVEAANSGKLSAAARAPKDKLRILQQSIRDMQRRVDLNGVPQKAADAFRESMDDAERAVAKAAEVDVDAARASVLAEADAALRRAEELEPLSQAVWTKSAEGREAMMLAFTHGWERWGADWLNEEMSPTVAAQLTDAFKGLESGKFGRHVDELLSIWKGYAVLTPGFHVRNFMGGMFNNWADHVALSSYRGFNRILRAWKAGDIDSLPANLRSIARAFEKAGVFTMHGQIGHELLQPEELTRAGRVMRRVLKKAGDNKVVRLNRRVGDLLVERNLRGAAAFDTMARGGTLDEALERMFHLHFDYNDLSRMERGVMRRLIPFWTWNSRNMGLMAEQLVRHPKAFARYGQLKRSIEENSGTPNLPIADYIGGLGSIFLGNGPSGPRFLSLDLPFTHLGKQIASLGTTTGFLQDANPLLKVPLELWANKQAFTGNPIEYEPGALNELPRLYNQPGLRNILDWLGVAKKGRNGQQLISPTTQYLLDQIPLETRLRKLLPEKATGNEVQDRSSSDRFASNLSSLFGVGMRTNDQATANSVGWNRADELQKVINSLKARGFLQPKDREARKDADNLVDALREAGFG